VQKALQHGFAFLVLGTGALASAVSFALPTCAQLATDPANGLAGNPQIVAATLTAAIIPAAPAAAPNPPGQPTATPPTPAY
jgi:hypothetical protein